MRSAFKSARSGDDQSTRSWTVGVFAQPRPKSDIALNGGFAICIDGLSFWLMRIAREIGCGTSMQALRERRARQERADARSAALVVQGMRLDPHPHARPRQAAGPEGGSCAALHQRLV